jgi:hypothetical protein
VDPASTTSELTPSAGARIALTLSAAIVLLVAGWSGWTVSGWLFGGATFAIMAVIGRGYWRPAITRELIRVAGVLGAIGIGALLVVFNLVLSAFFVGTGSLLGLAWRAIT